MDQPLVAVGLDAQAIPIVPDHDAAWYRHSAHPGQGDNVVLWGHVLRFKATPDIPAPFARVRDLAPGTPITIITRNGTHHTYHVAEQVWVLPDEVDYMLPQGEERLTLISCIGDTVVTDGTVDKTHRLITIARAPARAPQP